MELSLQTVLVNVTDLAQSIKFYQDVFDLRPTSQREEAAGFMINETSRRQVLVCCSTWPGTSSRSAQHRGGHL